MQRLSIVKLEIVTSIVLLLACTGHFGWCEWSVPRHAEQTPHGFETAACNWGTVLTRLVIALIAVLTLLSGLLGYRARSKTFAWYAAQAPAMVSWSWVFYVLVFNLIYSG